MDAEDRIINITMFPLNAVQGRSRPIRLFGVIVAPFWMVVSLLPAMIYAVAREAWEETE